MEHISKKRARKAPIQKVKTRAKARGAKPPQRRLWGAITAVTLWCVVSIFVLLGWFCYDIPTLGELTRTHRQPSVMVLCREGNVLATYGDHYGNTVTVSELPPFVANALLAIEDRRFYEHHGFDGRAILRALWVNIRSLKVRQGASTITQQLAKNLLLSTHRFHPATRTLRRKVQEAVLTILLEYTFTKKQILSLYLNRVYYGSGSYGIDAAARRYFAKRATQLNLFEASLLAGMVQAPSRLSPLNAFGAAHERAHKVLQAMVDCGFITQNDQEQASSDSVESEKHLPASMNARYFTDWVFEQLPKYIGEIDQDVVIMTTLDQRLQFAAYHACQTPLTMTPAPQVALVAMDANGAIKAMVGGHHDMSSPFNRATQAWRQPGSSFKLFVYLAALEQGLPLHLELEDTPLRIHGWAPKNFGWKTQGHVTLQDAFAFSVNTATIRLAQKVGLPVVIDTAQRLGFTSPLSSNLSLALGTSEATLLELTACYAAIAAAGQKVAPFGIIKITTRQGETLYQHSSHPSEQVIATAVLPELKRLLTSVVTYGTGRSLVDLVNLHHDSDLGGKTGTTQDHRDAWFIGYCQDLTAGVWLGHDQNQPMKEPGKKVAGGRISGGGLPVQIWRVFMERAVLK